jgi:hypothetical protein
VIEQVKSEDLDPSSMGPIVPRSTVRVGKTGTPRSDEDRGFEGPAIAVTHLAAVDASQPAEGGEATRTEVPELDRDEAEYSGPASGDAPVGVVITEETRRRAEDLGFLARRCPIRVELAKVGNTQAFDADATLWRLAQGIKGEVLARKFLADREHGKYAPVIVDFVLASRPWEWKLCPACGGAGHIDPDEGRCPECSGDGYLITF